MTPNSRCVFHISEGCICKFTLVIDKDQCYENSVSFWGSVDGDFWARFIVTFFWKVFSSANRYDEQAGKARSSVLFTSSGIVMHNIFAVTVIWFVS